MLCFSPGRKLVRVTGSVRRRPRISHAPSRAVMTTPLLLHYYTRRRPEKPISGGECTEYAEMQKCLLLLLRPVCTAFATCQAHKQASPGQAAGGGPQTTSRKRGRNRGGRNSTCRPAVGRLGCEQVREKKGSGPKSKSFKEKSALHCGRRQRGKERRREEKKETMSRYALKVNARLREMHRSPFLLLPRCLRTHYYVWELFCAPPLASEKEGKGEEG